MGAGMGWPGRRGVFGLGWCPTAAGSRAVGFVYVGPWTLLPVGVVSGSGLCTGVVPLASQQRDMRTYNGSPLSRGDLLLVLCRGGSPLGRCFVLHHLNPSMVVNLQ
jgi:hypothetical protein